MTVYEASPINARRRATRDEMDRRAEFLSLYAGSPRPSDRAATLLSRRGRRPPRYRQDRKRLRQDPAPSATAASDWSPALSPHRRSDALDAPADNLRQCRGGIAGDRPALPQGAVARCRCLCRDLVREGRTGRCDLPVTALYDVPLMVARGFSSETFASRRSRRVSTMIEHTSSITLATSTAPGATPPRRSKRSLNA